MRWWRRHLVELAILIATLGLALWATPAFGAFPYTRSGGDPNNFTDLYLTNQIPGDLCGDGNQYKFAASPDPANSLDNADPVELGGVRGAHLVDGQASQATSCDNDPPTTPTSASVRPTAFQLTLGRPDVTIAVLDSGIKWNDADAMVDLRDKIHLNRGELPIPQADLATAISDPSANDCSTYDVSRYDANGDRVFNVEYYACDSRVAAVVSNDGRRVGPPAVLTPQDLIIAFSNGNDADGNGYADDIAGWDFLDDDNDAFDDVQYGHGTGEIRGSTAEANNGADNGALIVQEALGTLNDSRLAQDAIDYAFRHGVVVIASAADEAAQHHNYPSAHEKPIVVNSVTEWNGDVPEIPRTYVAFNGCTNFSSKITLAIPS